MGFIRLVKATSVICLLGVGVGLGSLLIYKLYTRFFWKDRSRPKKKGKSVPGIANLGCNPCTDTEYLHCTREHVTPETPSDSGISECTSCSMGNSHSSELTPGVTPDSPTAAAFSSASQKVHFPAFRRREPSIPENLQRDASQESLSHQGASKLAHNGNQDYANSDRDHYEFISLSETNYTERPKSLPGMSNNEFDSLSHNSQYSLTCDTSDLLKPLERSDSQSLSDYSLVGNFSPVSLYERNLRLDTDDTVSEQGPASFTFPDTESNNTLWKESENTLEIVPNLSDSFPSPKLTRVSRSCSLPPTEISPIRELRMCMSSRSTPEGPSPVSLPRRTSVCVAEVLLGSSTPDIDESSDIGLATCESIDQIQDELSELQNEVFDINKKIRLLSSPDGCYDFDPSVYKSGAVKNVLRVLQKHKTDSVRPKRSISVCENGNDTYIYDRSSYHHLDEYYWDYRSDLKCHILHHVSSENTSRSSSSSPTFDHVKSHLAEKALKSSKDSPLWFLGENNSTTSDSSDQYIDDDIIDDHVTNVFQSDSSTSKNPGPTQVADGTNMSAVQNESDAGGSAEGKVEMRNKRTRRKNRTRNGPLHRSKHRDTVDGSSGRDSSVEDSDSRVNGPQSNREPLNFEPVRDLLEYVDSEWRGITPVAKTMRQGYHQIPECLGLHRVRRIRGDNYCALRAVLYQIAVNKIPIFDRIGSLREIEKKLEIFNTPRYSYLQSWNFAHRLPYPKENVHKGVQECFRCFFKKLHVVSRLNSVEERDEHWCNLLNQDKLLDIRLLEAVKVLMMFDAIRLYEEMQLGETEMTFPLLMYARDTSESPRLFLKNHLNRVGDSGGLEQVEMFLLGYSLGVCVKVVRPSQFGKEDFITTFSENRTDEDTRVVLIAEDDRHYNVALK